MKLSTIYLSKDKKKKIIKFRIFYIMIFFKCIFFLKKTYDVQNKNIPK